MIEPLASLSIRRQCELLAVSRSGWYYEPLQASAEELDLMRRIDELHLQFPFYGSRKLRQQLEAQGHRVNPRKLGGLHDTGDGLFSTEARAPSIVSAATFHFRVRDGNGWFHRALATGHDEYSKRSLWSWKARESRPRLIQSPREEGRHRRLRRGEPAQRLARDRAPRLRAGDQLRSAARSTTPRRSSCPASAPPPTRCATCKQGGLVEPIRDYIDCGRPFLGVCMGQQALLTLSEEGGEHPCLDIVHGRVQAPAGRPEGAAHGLEPGAPARRPPDLRGHRGRRLLLLRPLLLPEAGRRRASSSARRTTACGFASVLARDNVVATQFHPEKSGKDGLRFYGNFLRIAFPELLASTAV